MAWMLVLTKSPILAMGMYQMAHLMRSQVISYTISEQSCLVIVLRLRVGLNILEQTRH